MPPTKSKSKDNDDNYDVNITEMIKSAFNDEWFKTIIRKLIQSEVHLLNDTISKLREEVKVLQESNKDLVKLLTSGECLNKLEIMNQNFQETKSANNKWPTLHSKNSNKKDIDKKKEMIKTTSKKITDTQHSSVSNIQNMENKVTNAIIPNLHTERKNYIQYKQKPKIIFGSGSQDSTKSGFSAVIRKTWIYVGRASPGTSIENMRALLAEKFRDREFIIEKLPKWKNGTTESFKIGVDFDLCDDMFSSENWPTGTLVKKYKFFRSAD